MGNVAIMYAIVCVLDLGQFIPGLAPGHVLFLTLHKSFKRVIVTTLKIKCNICGTMLLYAPH